MTEHKVDFFCVGFPKSGTTTFYYSLKSHPEIFAPEIKEINYFNSDRNREVKKRLGTDYFEMARSDDEYLNFFQDGAGRIKGDFNPAYIFSEDAPKRIFNHNPEAKILISIREPVSFLRSYHFQSLYNMFENEPDFLQALALEESRRAGNNIPQNCHDPFHLYYSSLIEYKNHIKRFTDIFSYKNIKVVVFDDILKNESSVYQSILNFLDVKKTDFIPPMADQNPSHTLRLAWLRAIVLHPRVNKWLYTKIPKRLLPFGARISQSIFKKKQEKPYVSRVDIDNLKSRFKPKVIEIDSFLNELGLVNQDLVSLWGYKEIWK